MEASQSLLYFLIRKGDAWLWAVFERYHVPRLPWYDLAPAQLLEFAKAAGLPTAGDDGSGVDMALQELSVYAGRTALFKRVCPVTDGYHLERQCACSSSSRICFTSTRTGQSIMACACLWISPWMRSAPWFYVLQPWDVESLGFTIAGVSAALGGGLAVVWRRQSRVNRSH